MLRRQGPCQPTLHHMHVSRQCQVRYNILQQLLSAEGTPKYGLLVVVTLEFIAIISPRSQDRLQEPRSGRKYLRKTK